MIVLKIKRFKQAGGASNWSDPGQCSGLANEITPKVDVGRSNKDQWLSTIEGVVLRWTAYAISSMRAVCSWIANLPSSTDERWKSRCHHREPRRGTATSPPPPFVTWKRHGSVHLISTPLACREHSVCFSATEEIDLRVVLQSIVSSSHSKTTGDYQCVFHCEVTDGSTAVLGVSEENIDFRSI